MKNSSRIFLLLLLVAFGSLFSCKQKNLNVYAYDANKDTVAPVLTITVPVNLDNYAYGEDIHIVGTATDLESKYYTGNKAGKLKSLYLNLSIIDPVADTVKKIVFQKWANVDGKSGYTINEVTSIVSGVGVTNCRFTGVAVDYADRKDSSVVLFTVN